MRLHLHLHRRVTGAAGPRTGAGVLRGALGPASGHIGSPGVRGVDPWTPVDLEWTLNLCVTFEQKGKEKQG